MPVAWAFWQATPKAASDLDIPVIGIGLLYQEGYFRQIIDSSGMQQEFYPYNEPAGATGRAGHHSG